MSFIEVSLSGHNVWQRKGEWLEWPQCITNIFLFVALFHTLDLFSVLNRYIMPQDINASCFEPSDFVSQN